MPTEIAQGYTSINEVPGDETTLAAQFQSALFQLKEFLIEAGPGAWSVVASSDSSTSGASDLWVTSANVVRGTGAHSWIALRSPEGFQPGTSGTGTGDQSRVWLVLDARYANDHQAEISLHRTAPSGGSTTAAPTSANQLTWSNQQMIRSTLAASRFHGSRDADGRFWWGTSPNASSRMAFGVFVSSCLDYYEVAALNATQDLAYTAVGYVVWSDTGRGAFAALTTGGGRRFWNPDGTVSNAPHLTAEQQLGAGTPAVNFIGSAGNTVNGRADWTRLRVWNNDTNHKHLVGRLPDLLLCSNNNAQTQVVPSTGTPEYACIGDLFVPADDVPLF